MGLQDCPDWLLAEIVVLAKLTSVKQKMLVAGVIKDMCGIPLDYAKVAKWTSDAKLVKTYRTGHPDAHSHTIIRRECTPGRVHRTRRCTAGRASQSMPPPCFFCLSRYTVQLRFPPFRLRSLLPTCMLTHPDVTVRCRV